MGDLERALDEANHGPLDRYKCSDREQRGYDGNKKVRGRKRHLLVDTEGLVLRAKVHSAKVPDQDGLRLLLESARSGLSRLKHLWLDAGYEGRGDLEEAIRAAGFELLPTSRRGDFLYLRGIKT